MARRTGTAAAAQPRGSARTPAFATRVIRWQRTHGRHDLPWQNTRDAYRIWVSEIMLQQTQVAAVIGYYARFLQRFPGVKSLAAAPQEEVMRHWAGLGYYSRARNLHKAARIVMDEWGGAFPKTAEELATLPGIGRSTAAAIAVFAFGARAAILDGNVKRVMARHFGIEGYPGEKKVEEALWERVSGLLPKTGTEAYTQGLMDLGATLCTRTRPACTACPLQSTCVALRDGRTAELPVRKPKKALPHKSCVMLVLRRGPDVLLEKRPGSGIWGGLWCLPQFDSEAEARSGSRSLGAEWERRQGLEPIEHGFTHYRLTIHPVVISVARAGSAAQRPGVRSKAGAEAPARPPDRMWLALADAAQAALPAPVKKLMLSLAP